MTRLPAILCALLLCGCSTTLRNPQTGVAVLKTYANLEAEDMTIRANGDFSVAKLKLNHSAATDATARAISGGVMSLGSAAMGLRFP